MSEATDVPKTHRNGASERKQSGPASRNGARPPLAGELGEVDAAIREGRFQRWLSLVAGFSGLLSGAEVAYEHYHGSYSRRVMYTPVALSLALGGAGAAGFFEKSAARTVLPAVGALTLADGALGFYFHLRGVARKPGGWRLPVTNVVMGPPIFAPLLLGVGAYLGIITAFLQRGTDDGDLVPRPAHPRHWGRLFGRGHEPIGQEQDIREGYFQRQMAAATVAAAFLSGFEAWYSHYKNNFRYRVQYAPLVVAPLLMAAGTAAVASRRVAQTLLPAVSGLALVTGGVGFGYHVRGVGRRPGGVKTLIYNIVYGPPVFAPLLFAASGFLGLLASLLRRSGADAAAAGSASAKGSTVDQRPIASETGERLGPLAQPGYYPGYRTLSQQKFWDARTREVVLARVEEATTFRFFDAAQAAVLEAACARVIPQDDRDAAHRVPVATQIDKRLYDDEHDGYRYEDMPSDREAFILGLRAIDEMAQARYGRGFAELDAVAQETVLASLHDGKPEPDHPVWQRMPVHKFWMQLVQQCAEAYYAHPFAWDEIGFGGPAYPRAYMRLERGEPESWEVRERRYAWEAPPGARSAEYSPVAGLLEQYGSPGQGGTH